MAVKTLSARPLVRTLGALLLGIAVAGAPAMSYAQHSSGGGHGGGGGGGGHSGGGGGGGGHSGGGGGGHFSGGGHFGGGGHFSGGGHVSGGHYGGYYGGGHFAGGYSGGPHYMSHGAAFAGGYAAGARYSAGAHGYGGVHGTGYATGRFAGGRVFYPGRGYYPGRYWGGGYWNGVFWPHCYFYPGFAWYLPFLPFGYATFWWSGMPYYYANDLYYTYSPADNGYVVTEPPPAAGGDVSGTAEAPATSGAAGGAADVYVYPRNGQSDQQTANDRYECHSWAVGQTGFDPTRGGQQAGNPGDYRRAMVSCLDARGYSAR